MTYEQLLHQYHCIFGVNRGRVCHHGLNHLYFLYMTIYAIVESFCNEEYTRELTQHIPNWAYYLPLGNHLCFNTTIKGQTIVPD